MIFFKRRGFKLFEKAAEAISAKADELPPLETRYVATASFSLFLGGSVPDRSHSPFQDMWHYSLGGSEFLPLPK